MEVGVDRGGMAVSDRQVEAALGSAVVVVVLDRQIEAALESVAVARHYRYHFLQEIGALSSFPGCFIYKKKAISGCCLSKNVNTNLGFF